VLFPRTKDNTRSISIDLATQRLSTDDARTLLNRFLSLLSWCQDQHAVLGDGWSGNPVPRPISKMEKGGSVAGQWVFSRTLPEDPDLLNGSPTIVKGLTRGKQALSRSRC
jgi:hypothetical protein